MSVFLATSPAFDQFLKSSKDGFPVPATGPTTGARETHRAFVARNFLLEERLQPERVTRYGAFVSPQAPASFDAWLHAHNSYLLQRVFVAGTGEPGQHGLDTSNPQRCPETFLDGCADGAWQATDLDLDLLRWISVSDLAWFSEVPETEWLRVGKQALENPRDAGAQAALGDLLDEAFSSPRCDHRPVFATFYEDFSGCFRDDAEPDWPDLLRDRLGLYHISQWVNPGLPRPMFLFRYPVRHVPRRQGADPTSHRPLVAPTVLDHALSEAFCPAPQSMPRGRVVTLDWNGPQYPDPVREVLHPFVPLGAEHLFRIGSVRRPVPDDLTRARRAHIERLRELSGRPDFAQSTDGPGGTSP